MISSQLGSRPGSYWLIANLGMIMTDNRLKQRKLITYSFNLAAILHFKVNNECLAVSIKLSTEAIASTLRDTYQRLYDLPEPRLPIKYPREEGGYRPTSEGNPFNAWLVIQQKNIPLKNYRSS